jgi:coenzyme Q-binding protein COQ10
MKYLSNSWKFIPAGTGPAGETLTTIDFFVDFEFRNPFFQRLMGVFFNEVVRRMVAAFEDRAKKLYN